MHLVFHHVAELKHVDDADCRGLVETVAGAAVVEIGLAITGKSCLVGPFVEVIETRTVENRGGELLAEFTASPSENGLEYLSEVHTGRHTQRVEDYVHGRSVFEERHVFLTHDPGDDTLVAVAACHLVADADLTLLCDVDLSHLHNAGRQLVANRDIEFLPAQLAVDLFRLAEIVGDESHHHLVDALVVGPVGKVDRLIVDVAERLVVKPCTLCNDVGSDKVLYAGGDFFPLSKVCILPMSISFSDDCFSSYSSSRRGSWALALFLLFFSLLHERKVCPDYDSLKRWRSLEGSVLHVAGLIAENSAEKFLLRVGSLSPLGVILPIIMSPGTTCAPMRMMPSRQDPWWRLR